MSKISEIQDKDKPSLGVGDDVINNPSEAQKLAKNYRLYKEPNAKKSSTNGSSSIMTTIGETSEIDAAPKPPEAIIQPQDNATIKYLSNIKDPDTGKVSKPFVIGGKNYQMIRGILPNKTIVMGVYCFDDIGEDGKNLIHSVDDFDKNIATPIKKLEEEEIQAKKAKEDKQLAAQAIEDAKQEEPEIGEEPSYEGSKHFLVNRKNGNVRNFKNIKDLLSQEKLEEEDYMGVQEFKQHINKKLFGGRKKTDVGDQDGMLTEVTPTGQETDEEMSVKAQKLMKMIQKRIPENVISTIKTPVAKREVIAAFAEMIGVPRNGLTNLLSGLKTLSRLPNDQKGIDAQQQPQTVQPQPQTVQPQAAQPIQENKKIITKNDLINSLKVTKIIKVKDIK